MTDWLSKLKSQWQLFCLALMFFTRLPVPANTPYSEERMNQANRYFSAVGIVIAALVALSFYFFSSYFSLHVSVLLAMIISVFITGAFHEDGLADMADGIGGGLTVEKRLTIMKDSRIGTYGAITLVLSLFLKFLLLVDLAKLNYFIPSIFLAYALSRAVAASLISMLPYVADIDASKSKPLAAKQSDFELTILFIVGCLPFLFFISISNFSSFLFVCFAVLLAFRWLFKTWLIKRIGGFTGDCLGAAQQISELLIYLVIYSHLSGETILHGVNI